MPNVPDGVALDEAVRCLALAGVGGCAFESPFAALQATAIGSQTPGHPNFGFFRSWAERFVIVVSDGSECSWTPIGVGIFDPDGERAFWSDAQADAPTPAVCWNAGTRCETWEGVMDCEVGYYDLSGTPNGWADQIVLQGPMGIVDTLGFGSSWERTEFRFFIGVPVEGIDFLEFAWAEDPAFQLEFGIGPGCEGPDGTVGLPPVRTLGVVGGLGYISSVDEMVESICSDDFRPTLEPFGVEMVEAVTSPGCENRLCDVVPSTPELDIDCQVSATPLPWGDEEEVPVPECARDSDGAYLVDPVTGRPAMPGPEHEVCHLLRRDEDGVTPDPWDDMDPECQTDYGADVHIELVTADGRVPELQGLVSCARPTD